MKDPRADIINTVNLYAIAVDSRHWDLLDLVFLPSIEADYGNGALWTKLAVLKADFDVFHKPFTATQHLMANHTITISGSSAKALTYANWTLDILGKDGGDTWRGQGWYDDILVETIDGWRIQNRRCRISHWEGNPGVFNPGADVSFELETLALSRAYQQKEVLFLEI